MRLLRTTSTRPVLALSPQPYTIRPSPFRRRQHYSIAGHQVKHPSKPLAFPTRSQSTLNTHKMTPRALVFGTGSVGAVYTYLLSKSLGEQNVVAICRSNYDAATQNGITINSTIFGQNLTCRPHIVRSIAEAQALQPSTPFDYIIVSTKVLANAPSTSSLLKPIIHPTTSIVLLQNGIAIEQPYATAFPTNPILSGVIYLPVTQTSPAVFSHKEVETLHIGTYPTTAPPAHKQAAETLVSLLTTAGATAIHHDDVQEKRWTKLLVNASWNPICALSRTRDAQFMAASPTAAEYVRSVMLEIASTARAAGYTNVSDDLVDWQIGRAKVRELPGVEPSMMADALAGREMEVDAIVGNTVRIADEQGVSVPLLKGIYALASALNESFRRDRGET